MEKTTVSVGTRSWFSSVAGLGRRVVGRLAGGGEEEPTAASGAAGAPVVEITDTGSVGSSEGEEDADSGSTEEVVAGTEHPHLRGPEWLTAAHKQLEGLKARQLSTARSSELFLHVELKVANAKADAEVEDGTSGQAVQQIRLHYLLPEQAGWLLSAVTAALAPSGDHRKWSSNNIFDPYPGQLFLENVSLTQRALREAAAGAKRDGRGRQTQKFLPAVLRQLFGELRVDNNAVPAWYREEDGGVDRDGNGGNNGATTFQLPMLSPAVCDATTSSRSSTGGGDLVLEPDFVLGAASHAEVEETREMSKILPPPETQKAILIGET